MGLKKLEQGMEEMLRDGRLRLVVVESESSKSVRTDLMIRLRESETLYTNMKCRIFKKVGRERPKGIKEIIRDSDGNYYVQIRGAYLRSLEVEDLERIYPAFKPMVFRTRK